MSDVYQEAKKRVEVKKQFYKELSGFVTSSAFMILINLFTSSYLWFLWVIVPWGISILAKGLKIYFFDTSSPEWEKQAIRKEMAAMGYSDEGEDKEVTLDLDELKLNINKENSIEYKQVYNSSDLV